MGAHALEKVVRSCDDREKSILQMYQLRVRAQSKENFCIARAVAEFEQTPAGAWAAEGRPKVPA